MNVQDAMNQLGLRVEDADKKKFPEKLRREVLEYSQIKIANMLHNAYLTELEYIDESVNATGGILALSALTYKVLRGAEGILKVKLNGGKYCNRLDLSDLKRIENAYLEGTDDNPLYYVFQNTIYVFCTQTDPVIDVYYLRLPSSLYYPFLVTTGEMSDSNFYLGYLAGAYVDDYFNDSLVYSTQFNSYHVVTAYDGEFADFTVVPPASTDFGSNYNIYLILHPTIDIQLIGLSDVEFELNESLHDLVIDYAESELWKITAAIDRRNSSLEKVITQIKSLNDKYRIAEGIGTK